MSTVHNLAGLCSWTLLLNWTYLKGTSQNGSNLISKKIETMNCVESKVKSFPTLSTFCSSFVQDLFFQHQGRAWIIYPSNNIPWMEPKLSGPESETCQLMALLSCCPRGPATLVRILQAELAELGLCCRPKRRDFGFLNVPCLKRFTISIRLPILWSVS